MIKNSAPPTTIMITGASSGLGKALALEYAATGVNLFLCGRNQMRLQSVAENCIEKGAYVKAACLDIINKEDMAAWVNDCDANHPINLIIANAGISGGTGGQGVNSGETPQQVRAIFAVNVDGVLNTILPVVHKMKGRGSGQVALMSSLAGFRGLPSAPAYAASKAAVRSYGEGLRGQLKGDHIGVSVICPGYIKTPMTEANNFPMPMMKSPEDAAHLIAKKLRKNPARIVFPCPLYWVINFLNFLPPWMTDPLFNRLPKK